MADTLELIQALPTELRERILKEYIKIKLRERRDLGWDEVKESILAAPYCLENQQITWIMHCYKCELQCGRNYLCSLCYRNGVKDYLGPQIFNPEEYDPCFRKYGTINSGVWGSRSGVRT